MEAGGTARAVDHTSFQIVENDDAGTATKKAESIDDPAVELGLALRQGELDEHQSAIAEHGNKNRNLAGRAADLHATTCSPIDLHRLGWTVVDLLVDAPRCEPDCPEVATERAGAARVAVRATCNLFADAHR